MIEYVHNKDYKKDKNATSIIFMISKLVKSIKVFDQ